MCSTNGRRLLAVLAVCLTAGTLSAAELEDLVAPGAKVQKVAGECAFTEGPAWSPSGFLVFSDIPNNRILKVVADGTQVFLKPSGKSNGLIYDAAGRMYLCRADPPQVARLDSPDKKELTVLAKQFEGQPFNSPNDLALDSHGGVYFTDPSYGGKKSQPVQGVYYIAEDGTTTRVISDLERPNGILVSADGKTLYVAEPNHRELYAYAILAPGELTAGRRIFTGDENLDGSGPDGMTLDDRGNIYATYGSVVVLSSSGELIGRIEVPERPANVEFGGDDHKTLYITARTSLYSVAMQTAGLSAPEAGKLQGTPVAEAAGDAKDESKPGEPKTEKPTDDKPKAAAEKTKEVEVQTLKLAVPESWKDKPATATRIAQFEVPGKAKDDPAGEYVVYYFANGAGDAKANTLRWIKQFEGKERKFKVFTGESKQGKYTLVDVSGDFNKTVGPPVLMQSKKMKNWRMLGVILEAGDEKYYIKFDAPAAGIAAAEQSFRTSFGGDAKSEKAVEVKIEEE